ncbi:hypothetical protein BJV82DRAFT_126522 [Fennellomyces sp. T-0311]|nr:hypothetical protein BJV82DRAFT_126522 [Fennellomyces sp. T-0311]
MYKGPSVSIVEANLKSPLFFSFLSFLFLYTLPPAILTPNYWYHPFGLPPVIITVFLRGCRYAHTDWQIIAMRQI